MIRFVRRHWSRISTGLLALAIVGVAAPRLVAAATGDCCKPGAPCCYPGSPCCHHEAPPAPPGK